MKSLAERKVGTQIAKMLQNVQHDKGFIEPEDIELISDQVGEPLHVIQDVVSFFPHYRQQPPPTCSVSICCDMTCRLRGSVELTRVLRERCSGLETGAVEIVEASCLGRCDRAPAVLIHSMDPSTAGTHTDRWNDTLLVGKDAPQIQDAIERLQRGERVAGDTDQYTAVRAMDRSEIDCYRKLKTDSNPTKYQAVRKFISDPDPNAVIGALKLSGLFGMGGAGMPASSKWDEAKRAPGSTKYVVCNADESEPGTFKDRDILLGSPHLVIEGMIIAGLVIGAEQGFIYIRHEYHEQIEALRDAIEQAVSLGACGKNIFGSIRAFQLDVFVSPGGYVCGEQTALIEALEGKRSEPRNRPPELQTNGLYDQPTLLSNVETFAWVPAILLKLPPDAPSDGKDSTSPPRGAWYQQAGKGGSKGKRLFSISGDLNRPGTYEVPCGITLGELIDEYAGGMKGMDRLQAVALSGPSGGFLPAMLPRKELRNPKLEGTDMSKYPTLDMDLLDIRLLPLDLYASRELGFMLGAGIVVYGQSASMLDQAIACSRFYQRESCGKCVPCRIGSRKIADFAETLTPHTSVDPKVESDMLLLGKIMEATSICGLGQVASNPIQYYLRLFHRRDTLAPSPAANRGSP